MKFLEVVGGYGVCDHTGDMGYMIRGLVVVGWGSLITM